MNKKTIAYIKEKFPRLFFTVAGCYPLARLTTELDRPRYMFCMAVGKPYFGTVRLAGQVWQERRLFMQGLLRRELSGQRREMYRILEIGSWAGDSAVLWAETLKALGTPGRVTCVDAWVPYVKDARRERVNTATRIMDRALRKEQVMKLFLHNVRTSGYGDVVVPLRGSSATILPTLAEESFDLVYIDGDHSYSGVRHDLLQARRVLARGGIVCGDDLDLQADEVDPAFAAAHKEGHMVLDPVLNRPYHPGVTLAVAEFFGVRVSAYNGFWAMRKGHQDWQTVDPRT